jgi:GT2 family glycosyltransferase
VPDAGTVPPRVGVVILTQGDRRRELAEGIASVLAQEGVVTDVVVVGNGWSPVGLPVGVAGFGIEQNIGIPAGRNRGAAVVSGDHIFFLDDDARIPSARFLRDAIALIEEGRPAHVERRVLLPGGRRAPPAARLRPGRRVG